jgi:hypothetical protein
VQFVHQESTPVGVGALHPHDLAGEEGVCFKL